jgi:hypothetical protein
MYISGYCCISGSILNIRFGSEAAYSLQFSDIAAWATASGHKRTLATQKETRRSGVLVLVF